jgi:hypothetical protein
MLFQNCIGRFTSENDVINILTNSRIKGTNLPDLKYFQSLLFDPVDHDESDDYIGFYYGTNILRHELDLPRKGNRVVPGDIDILFIPYSDSKLYYDRSACFEVKVVRPHGTRPNKPPKSMGTKQVLGLIDDGFPLIGLIHVCTSTPLSKEEKADIHFCKVAANGPPICRPIVPADFEMVKADWLPGFSVDNQMRRMIRSGLPKYIAMEAFAINFGTDGMPIITLSNCLNGFNSGYFNPSTSKNTIECIKKHFLEHSGRYNKLVLSPKL